MTEDTRLQDIQRVLERIGYYADADTLRDVAQEIEALRAQVQKLQEEVRYWNARITAEGPQFDPEDFAT